MVRVSIVTGILLLSFTSRCLSVDSVFVNQKWSLEAGIKLLVPIQNTELRYGFDCFDCQQGEFNVKPRLTAGTFFLKSNYNVTHLQRSKAFMGSEFTAGLLHLERKTILEGYSCCGEFSVLFEGTITSIKRDDFFFLQYRINYGISLGEKLLLINQLNFGLNFLLHQKTIATREGTINDKSINSRWPLAGPIMDIYYGLGVSRVINKHLIFESGIEIPILVLNSIIWDDWQADWYRTSQWLVSSYSKPGSNFTFLPLRIGLVYTI